MADRRLLLPEVVVPDRRLGRSVHHDPRSLAYRVGRTATPTTVQWDRRIPVLDQGDLGSCVGNATVGVLGTEPFYSTLDPSIRALLAEPLAVDIYSAATAIDPWPGTWEPDDTGTDGLSAAKVVTARGLISGYQHVTSVGEAHAAIQDGSFIIGSLWMSGMDNPTAEGIVTADGYARGGHEYQCIGYDAGRDLWELVNSWSDSWGKAGRFFYDTAALTWLLGEQGDATPFVPVTQPAPTPEPTPEPDPEPAPTPVDPLGSFPFAELDGWATRRRPWWTRYSKEAADSYRQWRGKQ